MLQTAELIAFFVLTIAWDALWIQMVIIPFYSKSEQLYEKYSSGGDIDLAVSYIESQKLIPAIVNMFEHALKKHRGPKSTIDMESLLQSVDILPYLKTVEDSLNEKKAIEDRFSKLKLLASWLWVVGLLHVISVVTMPMESFFKLDNNYLIITFVISSSLFLLMIALYIYYSRVREPFLQLLHENGRSPS